MDRYIPGRIGVSSLQFWRTAPLHFSAIAYDVVLVLAARQHIGAIQWREHVLGQVTCQTSATPRFLDQKVNGKSINWFKIRKVVLSL